MSIIKQLPTGVNDAAAMLLPFVPERGYLTDALAQAETLPTPTKTKLCQAVRFIRQGAKQIHDQHQAKKEVHP
jgi:hypothetical protein